MTQPDTDFDRREFLRNSTISVAGLAAVPGVTVAQSNVSLSKLSKGEINVIDASITHPDVPERVPRSHGDGGTRQTFAGNDRLFLLKASPQIIDGNPNLLRTPRSLSPFEGTTQYIEESLYEQVFGRDVESTTANHLNVETKYDPFEFHINVSESGATVTRRETEVGHISEGTTKEIQLSEQTITIPILSDPIEKEIKRPGVNGSTTVRKQVGTEKITVTPQLRVQNHGRLSVLGHKDGMVLPQPVPQPIIHVFQGIANSRSARDANTTTETRIETVSDELLLIRNGSKSNGGDSE